jgi:hypothetical protein
MYTSVIQIAAVALFAICLYHAWQFEGRKYAQQWFVTGYLFALIRENLLVSFNALTYSDQMLRLGSAPTLTTLLLPALFYIAYLLARRLVDTSDLRPIAYLMFLLAPALTLPIDATALQFGWWTFPSESLSFLNGIPYYVPFAWGASAALFYAFIWRVRKIRLRGSGQLFALITLSPLIAGINLLLIGMVQAIVFVFALAPQGVLLDGALVLVLIILPLAWLVRIPNFNNLER